MSMRLWLAAAGVKLIARDKLFNFPKGGGGTLPDNRVLFIYLSPNTKSQNIFNPFRPCDPPKNFKTFFKQKREGQHETELRDDIGVVSPWEQVGISVFGSEEAGTKQPEAAWKAHSDFRQVVGDYRAVESCDHVYAGMTKQGKIATNLAKSIAIKSERLQKAGGNYNRSVVAGTIKGLTALNNALADALDEDV